MVAFCACCALFCKPSSDESTTLQDAASGQVSDSCPLSLGKGCRVLVTFMSKSDLKPAWVTESPRSKAAISHLLATSKQVVEKIRNLEANWIIHQRKTISWPFSLPKPTVPEHKDPGGMLPIPRWGWGGVGWVGAGDGGSVKPKGLWNTFLTRNVLGAAGCGRNTGWGFCQESTHG